jgi:hypothetical protein
LRFLDTSVLLAACGSLTGASLEIFRRASDNGWILVATQYGARSGRILSGGGEGGAEGAGELRVRGDLDGTG